MALIRMSISLISRIRDAGGAAAVIAGLVLTSHTPAHALAVSTAPTIQTGYSVSNNIGTYTFTTTGPGSFTFIEIPELNAGDLVFGSGSSPFVFLASTGPVTSFGSLPFGWLATEVSAPRISGSALKNGLTATAYIQLETVPFTFGEFGYNPLTSSNPLSFSAVVKTSQTIDANFSFVTSAGSALTIDPPVPNSGVPVPEPATLALLGAAVATLVSHRRR